MRNDDSSVSTVDGGVVSICRSEDAWVLTVHDGVTGASALLTCDMLVMLFADVGIDVVMPK